MSGGWTGRVAVRYGQPREDFMTVAIDRRSGLVGAVRDLRPPGTGQPVTAMF
jgi:hypothetical protein